MATVLLLDTDVLVDFSRGFSGAVEFMKRLRGRPMLSAVTVAELYAGVREGRERHSLDQFVTESIVVAVDPLVAERGGLLARQYRSSHGTGLADAMISATAEIERATLVTLNVKHFPMLTDVQVPYIRT